MKTRWSYGFILGLTLGSFPMVRAAETENMNSAWLYDFFSQGIKGAYAEYTVSLNPVSSSSDQFHQRMSYSIAYSDLDRSYELRFSYEYHEDWNKLTHNGSANPPKQQPYFTGSKISPWTNSNGVGVYVEQYERKIPNWQVFSKLDSLLMIQAKMGNPLPPLTGLFNSDELKYLRKVFKDHPETDWTANPWLAGFEFDHAGNVTELSRGYLSGFTSKGTNQAKKLDDYTLSIRNRADQVVFISVLTSELPHPILEGIQFKSGEKKCTVFNFDVNQLLHKFAPELVADPNALISEYLLAMQKESGKTFSRFEITASK